MKPRGLTPEETDETVVNEGNAQEGTERKRWPRNVFIALAVAIGVGVLFTVGHLKSFQDCKCESQKQYNAKDQNNEQARFMAYFSCYGLFFEVHAGAVSTITSLLIAVFTGTLWWATKQLQDASIKQAQDMQRSIAESARAASAMEEVAKHFADNVATFRERSSQQMRAYVGVNIGSGTYQDRVNGLKFAGRPMMVNNGSTPAHEVKFRIAADILPLPLPDDFAFPLPEEAKGGAPLNPQQTFTIQGVVRDFCDDAEVIDIMRGRGQRALYVWGVVTYEDVFGELRSTRFSQIITWIQTRDQLGRIQEVISGFFTNQHNEST